MYSTLEVNTDVKTELPSPPIKKMQAVNTEPINKHGAMYFTKWIKHCCVSYLREAFN